MMFCKMFDSIWIMLWPLVMTVMIIINTKLAVGQGNTRSNQGNAAGFVNPSFFNPTETQSNFTSGRFGNPATNNYYLMNPFSPFSNQGTNQGLYPGQQQQQYPNQIVYPNQFNNPSQGSYDYNPGQQNNPGQLNGQGQVNYPNQQWFPTEGNNLNQQFYPEQNYINFKPGYNRVYNPAINYVSPNPSYPQLQNSYYPNNMASYGNLNRPYQGQSGQLSSNQGGNNYGPDNLSALQYPRQKTHQYYSHGTIQDNLNDFPGQEYRPYNPNIYNVPNTNNAIIFPGPTSNPSSVLNSVQMDYPLNSYYNNMNKSEQGLVTPTQVPNPLNNAYPGANLNSGMIYYIPQNQPLQLLDSQNNNNTVVAIMGKPVIVPPTNLSPEQVIFNDSTESPALKQCVQDCQTTSEYNPVCGSDNITYINPGKFSCARNCGINVYVQRMGVCEGDIKPNLPR